MSAYFDPSTGFTCSHCGLVHAPAPIERFGHIQPPDDMWRLRVEQQGNANATHKEVFFCDAYCLREWLTYEEYNNVLDLPPRDYRQDSDT